MKGEIELDDEVVLEMELSEISEGLDDNSKTKVRINGSSG